MANVFKSYKKIAENAETEIKAWIEEKLLIWAERNNWKTGLNFPQDFLHLMPDSSALNNKSRFRGESFW